jgi:hypothetical protein
MTTLLILHVSSGLLLILLSLPLLWGKVPPNGLYGFRMRATLEDPIIWYAVNKFAAKRMLWSGVIFVDAALILYFIPGVTVDVYAVGCLFLFVVPLTIGLVQSVRYMKSLARKPDKAPVPLVQAELGLSHPRPSEPGSGSGGGDVGGKGN